MLIGAPVPWFGGKRAMASIIIKQLGPHKQYFEPFCGSMAVLFAKQPAGKETVNDLHCDLINLARCLQDIDAAELLYDRLGRLIMGDDALEQAETALADDFDPEDGFSPDRAYWYFLACWMGRNGTAGTLRQDYQLAVRWTKGGGSPTTRFRNAVDSIPPWHRRLQNVVILKRDAFSILDRFEDDPATAIYVDPPYHARSRNAIKNGSGAKYKHEIDHVSETNDHHRIHDILSQYKQARVVVSYYDCPQVRDIYKSADWTYIDCARNKQLHQQNGRGERSMEAPEILITNGPEL